MKRPSSPASAAVATTIANRSACRGFHLAFDVGANKCLNKAASVEVIIAALREVIAKPHAAPCAGALTGVEVLKEYNQ
jgi:DNA-binding NarL/FixJ family response regulator